MHLPVPTPRLPAAGGCSRLAALVGLAPLRLRSGLPTESLPGRRAATAMETCTENHPEVNAPSLTAPGAPGEASTVVDAAPGKRTLDHAPAQLTGPNDGVGVVHEPVVHV